MTATSETKQTDPVCKMEVDQHAKASSEYAGITYYFCAPGCKIQFDKDPGHFVSSEQRKSAPGLGTCE